MIYIMILRRMVTCWEKKRPKGRYWTWSESSQGLSMAKGLLMAVRKNTRGGRFSIGIMQSTPSRFLPETYNSLKYPVSRPSSSFLP